MKQGKFVVIEGNGGTGKSTTRFELVELLNQKSPGSAVGWSFPDKVSPIGKMLRDYLSKEVELSPKALMPLFLADMVDRRGELETLLLAGKTVVCDRYFYSTMVYQAEHYPQSEIAAIVEDLKLVLPDVGILLDLPDYIVAERLQKRGTEGDRFDEVDQARLWQLKFMYRRAMTEFPAVSPRKTLIIQEPWTRSGITSYCAANL
jgi:dTMP kinase